MDINNIVTEQGTKVDKSTKYVQQLDQKITTNQAQVAIIGLGYVGLPLAFALYNKFNVVGFDLDQQKINKLHNNQSYIKSFTDQDITKLNQSKRFTASCQVADLASCDAILICVPTPLTKNREPDLNYVKQTAASIATILRPGQLIILESTTYPGTTAELLKTNLEQQTKLKSGQDFFVAYSPEREDPGNKNFTAASIPKVVGADDDASKQLAIALYSQIVPEVIPVSSAATAEAVKIFENIFRCVNIALVNELKVVFDKMGINVWEVIEAAKSKPFGFMPFYPSPGLGGHCIPIDPFYLTWKAREYDAFTKFIELAGEINSSMPDYVIQKLRDSLDERFAKVLNGSKILLVGMAYKKNVDDIRESPSLEIMQRLLTKKANVDYYDPYIEFIPECREYPNLAYIYSLPELSAESLQSKAYDAVIICTDHDKIDYQLLVANSKLIIDTRNATSTVKNSASDSSNHNYNNTPSNIVYA
jgi:UDP-N-acetyl-D-glucosamine dehydrogenase